jgi:hypothetical protein
MLLSIDVGIKNLAMCMIHPTTKQIKYWEVGGVPPLHSDGLFPCFKKHLNERKWVLEASTVLIEKQPDKNKSMKSIENFLHTYFLIHDKDVIIYDARHKVPDFAGPGKVMYNKRKKASIERAREFIKDTTWVSFFDKHKKKDDLADTVMQALSFIDRVPVKKKEAKKVAPRKPTENQKRTKYSKSNLAWIVKSGLPQDARFTKDLKRYYNNLQELCQEFNILIK